MIFTCPLKIETLVLALKLAVAKQRVPHVTLDLAHTFCVVAIVTRHTTVFHLHS